MYEGVAFTWENFSRDWVLDIANELKLEDRRVFQAPYGELPDVWQADPAQGAGGEAAHGMLVLSPRAIGRLTDHVPHWPVPKLFRMVSHGLATEGLFCGETINTSSLLAVEDVIDGLRWARDIGGLPVLKARCQANFDRAAEWVGQNTWCDFLANRNEIRSPTSICLKIVDPELGGDLALQSEVARSVVARLAQERVAFDVGAYPTAPPGFRFWGGATVDVFDLSFALDWLSWCYCDLRKEMRA